MAWHLGRLKIATGIATLAAATAILFVSGGRNRDNVNLQDSAKIIPLVLAGISLFFLTSRGDSKQSDRRAPRTVRTG